MGQEIMRAQILSDLHFDFHRDGGRSFVESLDPDGVDVLIVAGDIGHMVDCFGTLESLCNRYPHVIYVRGNHDYYLSDRVQVEEILTGISTRNPNFHTLENDTVTIDGQRFVGTTLWFPTSPMEKMYRGHLNDFNYIRDNFAEWVFEANREAQECLRTTVTTDDVVVTHHIPTPEGTLPHWRRSPLNVFYVTDMTDLIQQAQPKLWAYGHTHDSHDFRIGRTRLVCNPFGYARREENLSFDWKLVVEV